MKDTPISEFQKKPPLGLIPKRIVQVERCKDIVAAMARYDEVNKEIPQEWHEELREIINGL